MSRVLKLCWGNRKANISDSEQSGPSQSQPTSDELSPDNSEHSNDEEEFIETEDQDSAIGNESILQQLAPEQFQKLENSKADLTESEFFQLIKIFIKNSLDENYLKELYFASNSEELRILQKLDQGNF